MTNAERQFTIEQLELFELSGPYTEEEIKQTHDLLKWYCDVGLEDF